MGLPLETTAGRAERGALPDPTPAPAPSPFLPRTPSQSGEKVGSGRAGREAGVPRRQPRSYVPRRWPHCSVRNLGRAERSGWKMTQKNKQEGLSHANAAPARLAAAQPGAAVTAPRLIIAAGDPRPGAAGRGAARGAADGGVDGAEARPAGAAGAGAARSGAPGPRGRVAGRGASTGFRSPFVLQTKSTGFFGKQRAPDASGEKLKQYRGAESKKAWFLQALGRRPLQREPAFADWRVAWPKS